MSFIVLMRKKTSSNQLWLVVGALLEQFPLQVDFLLYIELICHLIMHAFYADPDAQFKMRLTLTHSY